MTIDPTQPVAPTASTSAPAPATLIAPSPSPNSNPTPAGVPAATTAPIAPVLAITPRAKSGGVLNLLLIGAAILAVGGVAFAVGRSTAPASAFPGVGGITGGPIIRPDGSFAPGAGGPRGFVTDGGLAIHGTVTAVDADSITLTLENGDERSFTLDGDTTYHEATDATATDVAVGDDVSVTVDGGGRVQSSTDGSIDPELRAHDITVAR